jgi:hypothetical protein
MLEGSIPRIAYSVGRQDTKDWLQCFKAAYQGLWTVLKGSIPRRGLVLEGGIPRTEYSVCKENTRDWVQYWKTEYQEQDEVWKAGYKGLGTVLKGWKAVTKIGGSFRIQDTKDWRQFWNTGYQEMGTECLKAGYQDRVQFWKAVTKDWGQFWNTEYQELFEGRMPRTVYIIRRRDTTDYCTVYIWVKHAKV